MDKPRLRHRVEYTRNKHSRAVYRGNTIIIRLARNLSKAEESEHIQSLLRRMTHLVLQEKEKETIDPFRPLLDGAQTLTVKLHSGKRIVFTLFAGSRTVARKSTNGWRITVSPNLRRRALHRLLWSLVAKTEAGRLEHMLHAVNEHRFGLKVREVKVSFATTQWGSCSSRGIIMLNSALLFLPRPLAIYVMAHELAHLLVPNHSPAYWRAVEKHMPGYEKYYKQLQEYRLPTL